MTSTYEDTVFDFDLNFLRQNTNNTSGQGKFERQKRSIAIVKKKIIATDSLIGKYYTKKHELEETEKNLLAAKDECKQICIDYTNVMETCSRLEAEAQLIQCSKKQLEERCFNSENQCQAIQSHVTQLQALVDEHGTVVESLKVEINLERAAARNNEKKALSLKKENVDLLRHICLFRDIILGKRNLSLKYRTILKQYANASVEIDSDNSVSEGDNSDAGEDVFEDVMSPYSGPDSPKTNASEVKKKSMIGRDVTSIESENDFSNEIVSVDTGRGSSLAFSDTEKCFHSPDYYMDDSPSSRETIEHKVKVKTVDIATSPLTFSSTVEVATSPINIPQEDVLCQIIIEEDRSSDSSNHTHSPHKPNNENTKSVSPVKLNLSKSILTSPQSPIKDVTISSIQASNVTATHNENIEKTIQEKECLDVNNINNYLDENSNDCEVEMILNTMRLNHKLVTPIPATPATSSRCVGPVVASSQSKQTESPKSSVCQEAVIAREENKKLHASIADLAKEMVSIKSLIQNQLLFSNKMCAHTEVESLMTHNLLNDGNTVEIHSNPDDDHAIPEDDNDRHNVCSPILEDPIIITNQDLQSFEPEADPSQIEYNKTLQSSDIESDTEILETTCHDSISPKIILDRLEFEDSMPLPPMRNNTTIKQVNSSNVASLTTEDGSQRNQTVQENDVITKDKHDNKIKNRKLTKLDKLKKKLIPKLKIRSEIKQPLKNLRIKPKQLPSAKVKITTGSDTSATLNDKDVYEKAVKVMADLKAKHPKTPKSSADLKVSKNQNVMTASEALNNSISDDSYTSTSPITTRSRKKCVEQLEESSKPMKEIESNSNHRSEILNNNSLRKNDDVISTISPRITRKRNRLSSSEKPEIQCKRILRSSTVQQSTNDDENSNVILAIGISEHDIESANSESIGATKSDNQIASPPVPDLSEQLSTRHEHSNTVTYDDLDMFSEGKASEPKIHSPEEFNSMQIAVHPKDSILGVMLQKYGVQTVKTSPTKISDKTTKSICEKIESSIAQIIELPANETKNAMNKLVGDIKEWNYKNFMTGLMKYLSSQERKVELFGKVVAPPAPPMTKSEQVLLYVITQLRNFWPSVDITDAVLCNIEYTLFRLNQTPVFDVIESMSHFYAVLCRYFKMKSRLRLFILDAMYCIQFKSVPLIKQCLDVWMHIIPLAHMGIAKSPLVTALVYLLHFYKCDDRFNRVQDIRNILQRKYFYRITEWNETKILEMIKNSIKDLRDIPIEKKMLRLAVIIIAKRHGARWCQKNIIKNILQSMIEQNNVPDRVKEYCVSLIGPLMKPYPMDMKVQCEIAIQQLIDVLNKNPSARMEEAVITSLVCMGRHNQNCVNKVLLSSKFHGMTPQLEDVLRDYVREKPLRTWKVIFAKSHL